MAVEKMSVEVGLVDKFTAGFKNIDRSFKEGVKGLSLSTLGWAAAAGTVAYAFKASIDAAAEAQVKMAQFDVMVKNTTGSTAVARQKLLDMADAATKLGFDDEEAALSLGKFYQRTKDVTEAQKLNNLAMDLARAKSIGLSEASNVISLALSGNAKALKQYGIELKAGQNPVNALIELQGKLKGSAEAFSKTYKGQMEILGVNFDNLKEKIGAKLLPVLTTFLTNYMPVILQAFDKIAIFVAEAGRAIGMILSPIIKLGQAFGWLAGKIGEAGQALANYFAKAVGGSSDYNSMLDAFSNQILYSLGDSTVFARQAAADNEKLKNSVQASTKAIDEAKPSLDKYSAGLNYATDAMSDGSKKTDDAKKKAKELEDNMKKLGDTYRDTTKNIKDSLTKMRDDHTSFLGDINEKIAKTKKAIEELNNAYNTDKGNDRKGVADAIVAQEQRILDLQKQIKEEQTGGSPDQVKIKELNDELTKEQNARAANAEIIKGFDSEVATARKEASMTDLERAISDFNQRRLIADQEFALKNAQLKEELAAYQAQKDAEALAFAAAQAKITLAMSKTKAFYKVTMDDQSKMTDDFVNFAVERYKKLQAAAEAATAAAAQARDANPNVDVVTRSSLPGRAKGGSVMAGNTYIVGENGAETFTPSSNGVITPHGAGATIVFNFNGTVSSKEVAAEYADFFVRSLQQSTKVV